MRAFIEDKLQKMLEQNHTRVDFAQKLQEIIDAYNSGGSSIVLPIVQTNISKN